MIDFLYKHNNAAKIGNVKAAEDALDEATDAILAVVREEMDDEFLTDAIGENKCCPEGNRQICVRAIREEMLRRLK